MPTDKRARQRAGREARRQAAEQARRRAARRRQIISIAVLAAVVLGIGFLISRSGDGGDEDASPAATTTPTTAAPPSTEPISSTPVEPQCPPAEGATARTTKFTGPPPMCIDTAKLYTAVIETDVGTITMELLDDKAPKTANNFVFLARHRYYDGVPFHRVIPDFVVQGGDANNADGTGGPGYQFEDELPAPGDYAEGSVAMANSGANTNGSQFFIVTSAKGAETLVQAVGGEAKYSLFGKVTEGLDVVKKIEADGTQSGTPKVVHRITKVTIKES